MPEQLVGSVEELGPGSVRGVGDWAVLNVNGERYAVSRRCRHLRADLANGEIDDQGHSARIAKRSTSAKNTKLRYWRMVQYCSGLS